MLIRRHWPGSLSPEPADITSGCWAFNTAEDLNVNLFLHSGYARNADDDSVDYGSGDGIVGNVKKDSIGYHTLAPTCNCDIGF